MDTSTALHTPAGIGRLLRSTPYATANEAELEKAIGDQLVDLGFNVEHQRRLNDADRIDLVVSLGSGMLGTELGIELKVKGDPAKVRAQLMRYANSVHLDELMLITTQRRHLIGLPEVMNGKTVHRVLVQVA